MAMIFFTKCIVYMIEEDLIIHEKIRVKNVFRFSYTDEEYAETLVSLIVKYTDYSISEINKEVGLLITFIKLVRNLNIDEYMLAIKINEYCKER